MKVKIISLITVIGLLIGCQASNTNITAFSDIVSKELTFAVQTIEIHDSSIYVTLEIEVTSNLQTLMLDTKDDILYRIDMEGSANDIVDYNNLNVVVISKKKLADSTTYECNFTIPTTRKLNEKEIKKFSDPQKYILEFVDKEGFTVIAFN